MQNNITGLLVVHNLLAEELDGVVLAVGVERFGQYLVRLALPMDAAALGDNVVPPHAHDLHAVGIQRTCGHSALAFLPIDIRMYAGHRLPLDASRVEPELTQHRLLAVQDGHAVFEKST